MSNWTYTVGDGYYYNHMTLVQNAMNVKAFFEEHYPSMTKEAIIGIIANMEHESYLNPGQQEHGKDGSTSYGYGLVMWTPARTKILAYATGASVDWYDGDAQLDYCRTSIPSGWIESSAYPYSWSEYQAITDYNEATRAFFYNFERGTWHNELDTYSAFWANELYGDTPPTPDPPLPPSPEEEDEDSAVWLLLRLFKIL